jgi:hypothetical protein
MSCALVGWLTGVGTGAGIGGFFGGGAFLGGAGFAVAFVSGTGGASLTPATGGGGAIGVAVFSKVARNRRATGASIVLDADLTYSPIS